MLPPVLNAQAGRPATESRRRPQFLSGRSLGDRTDTRKHDTAAPAGASNLAQVPFPIALPPDCSPAPYDRHNACVSFDARAGVAFPPPLTSVRRAHLAQRTDTDAQRRLAHPGDHRDVYTTATTAGEPADNCENRDREADGDGEDDGGESECQRPHRGQRTGRRGAPCPRISPRRRPSPIRTCSCHGNCIHDPVCCARIPAPPPCHRHQQRSHEVGGGSAQGPALLRYAPSVSPVVRVPDPSAFVSRIPLRTSLFALQRQRSASNATSTGTCPAALLEHPSSADASRLTPLRACAPLESAVAPCTPPHLRFPFRRAERRQTPPPTLTPAPA